MFDENLFTIENYQEQFLNKASLVENQLVALSNIQLEKFPSEIKNFRMRAEFRIWHEGDEFNYVMFDQKTKERKNISDFPIASVLINEVMIELKRLLSTSLILKNKLFQIDFLSTLSGEILVTLIYHKKLDEHWEFAAKQLITNLSLKFLKLKLIGRSKKQKIIFSDDFVVEEFTVLGKKLFYKQVENSFTQPNAKVAVQMLEWVMQLSKNECNKKSDLLELYCGNANFSIALAENFNKVLATEISSSSVLAANYNLVKNQILNVQVIKISAEDFTKAINKERDFFRLKEINLDNYNFKTILVDPPRSGLDDLTLKLASRYDQIFYISCNPVTLFENLMELLKTHKILNFAIFDQFPYTHHVECGVYLSKN